METIHVINGDSKEILKTFPDNYFHAIICDPPYEIGFMSKAWDSTGIAYDQEFWQECLRVLKHGGYLASFSATTTYHRMATAIENAGFEIRDTINVFYDGNNDMKQFMDSLNSDQQDAFIRLLQQQNPLGMWNWVYSQGMPKGQNIGKAIEKASLKNPSISSETIQAYQGYNTTLKPSNEPICLARKPYPQKTLVDCIVQNGTGALNVDDCRIPRQADDRFEYGVTGNQKATTGKYGIYGHYDATSYTPHEEGRYPSNVVFEETVSDVLNKQEAKASRFFYCPKATKKERGEFNHHTTVKPLELMRWLVSLLVPPNGIVLDPFAGSGSTLVVCQEKSIQAVGIEREKEYVDIINKRLEERR